MNNHAAKQLSASLLQKKISGWTIVREINHGKSAVVFEGKKGHRRAAIKVFDPELINEFGREQQLERVKREQSLKGHHNPHLVTILDGGECPVTQHIFVAMELIKSKNLAQVRAEVPDSKIATIISQVAGAAQFLEVKGFAHRDIKPENIAIDKNFSKAILLDLGVMRPFKQSALTDGTAGKDFLATLRYSSPTYLVREDDGTPDSLRALTFYQLGGVLHDLLMKRELFAAYSRPWARLVRAIQVEVPVIDRIDVDPRLCNLARNCLLKSDEARLQAVKWEDFTIHSLTADHSNAIRNRVLRRLSASSASAALPLASDMSQKVEDAVQSLVGQIRTICSSTEIFPPIECFTPEVTGTSAQVRVVLSADTKRLIDRTITLVLQAQLLEASSGTMQCFWSAAFGGGRPCVQQPIHWNMLYTGPMDGAILRQRIDDMLVKTIDFAQSKFTGVSVPFYEVDQTPPTWITTVGSKT